MGQLVFNATLGGTTALVGPNTAATNSLTIPNASGALAWSTSALTSGRVTYAGTGGLLQDNSLFVFDGTNLGIGTATPSGFLGNKLVIATGGTANEGMTIYSSSNNGSIWFAKATTGTGRYQGGIDYQHSTDRLYFYSATQGNMILDGSGNLGIGAVPSTWTASSQAIEGVYGSISFGSTLGTTLAANLYYGTSAWRYKITSSARLMIADANSFQWYNAPSGTAGTAATLTQAMTLDSSGNLLVGTTAANAKVHVQFTGSSTQGILSLNTNTDTTGTYLYWGYANGSTKFLVYGNGGIANFQANNSNLSDKNVKKDFAPAKSYINTICSIPVQTFKYINQQDNELNLGVVAQDVQAVAPELVTESNWGTPEKPEMRLSVYQTDLQYALMKCIQELNAKVTALEAQLGAK